MHIDIYCPNNNCVEREYAIKVLFSTILDTNYSIHFSNVDNYEFRLENGKKLVINDCFFNSHQTDLSYLNKDNIPTDVVNATYDINGETQSLVVLYGDDRLTTKGSEVYCGADLIASSFFMLTRWEESCIDKRDQYNTIDEYSLLSIREDFFRRPIVNEYATFIKCLLASIGCEVCYKKVNINVYATYDVDDMFCVGMKKFKRFVISSGGDLLHRKDVKMFIRRCIYMAKNVLSDLYSPFEEILKITDKNIKNIFFFKCQRKGEYGATYDINDSRIASYMDAIIQMGGGYRYTRFRECF